MVYKQINLVMPMRTTESQDITSSAEISLKLTKNKSDTRKEMNHRPITTTIILAVTTAIMGQDNYQGQSVLPIDPNPSSSIGIHGNPLGIWKPGGDLPLHGGTRKSDPFDPLLSSPLGSLDLSALGPREARLRQWLADNSISFDNLRADLHPNSHHDGAHIKPPVNPSKPNLHGTIDPAIPHGKISVIDPLLNGGNLGATLSGGFLPAEGHLFSGFNSGGFVGANSDPRIQQGFVDNFPGVGQVIDALGHIGSHSKPIVKDPVKKEVFLGEANNGIRDPNFVSPILGVVNGAANLQPIGKTGGVITRLIDDPRRKPTVGFPTGY